MIRRYVALVALVVLAGCASYKNEVAALQVVLTQVEKAALEYARLPLCPAQPVCAERKVLEQIRVADKVAFAAVSRAREAVYDPAMSEADLLALMRAAQLAVGTYRDIVGAIQ